VQEDEENLYFEQIQQREEEIYLIKHLQIEEENLWSPPIK
jgi:hypothetical protein